jgi:hypothetical protein
MAEVFVDLQVRGLPLASRVRLSQMDASLGYLELSTPMPVGTMVSLDGAGPPLTAIVVEVHEQSAGVDRPGMKIRPVLDAHVKVAWWAQTSGQPMTAASPEAASEPALGPAASSEPAAALAPEPMATASAALAGSPPAPAAPPPEAVSSDAGEATVDSVVFIEAASEADASDAVEVDSPEPPAGSTDSAPRGKKKRRGNRR